MAPWRQERLAAILKQRARLQACSDTLIAARAAAALSDEVEEGLPSRIEADLRDLAEVRFRWAGKVSCGGTPERLDPGGSISHSKRVARLMRRFREDLGS
jgi:hypothetical protein